MPDANIKIVYHGDPPPWGDDNFLPYIATDSWRVAILEEGMQSGSPSIALELDVPEVGKVIAQTSLGILMMILAAARGAFPESFRGTVFDSREG